MLFDTESIDCDNFLGIVGVGEFFFNISIFI